LTAKEYLRQIRRIDVHLDHLLKERDELERAQTYLRSPQIDGDRVQTSPSGDPPWMGYILKWEKLTEKIGAKWDELIELKMRILTELHELDDNRYVAILVKRYVEFKSWHKIAYEMNYSIDHVFRLHGEALRAFERRNMTVNDK